MREEAVLYEELSLEPWRSQLRESLSLEQDHSHRKSKLQAETQKQFVKDYSPASHFLFVKSVSPQTVAWLGKSA